MIEPRQATPDAPNTPQFSLTTFLIIAWFGFGLCTVFSGGRYYLRFRTYRTFFVDDAFVLVALLMVLASTITWQLLAKDMFMNNAVSRGVIQPPEDFIERTETLLKSLAAMIVLFYCILWSIKLAFLFFFRRLYHSVSKWAKIWWVIFVITIVCFAVSMGNNDFKCLTSSLDYIQEKCRSSERIRHFQKKQIIVICVLDIFTDILITCIPIAMLWKVRISRRRKLALAGVFSATVITIVTAIVRAYLITRPQWRADMTWLFIWNNVECYAAILVASVGSFRSLFLSNPQVKKCYTPEAGHTIGSPPRKRRLGSLAHMWTPSIARDLRTESQSDMVEMWGNKGAGPSDSGRGSSNLQRGDMEPCHVRDPYEAWPFPEEMYHDPQKHAPSNTAV